MKPVRGRKSLRDILLENQAANEDGVVLPKRITE